MEGKVAITLKYLFCETNLIFNLTNFLRISKNNKSQKFWNRSQDLFAGALIRISLKYQPYSKHLRALAVEFKSGQVCYTSRWWELVCFTLSPRLAKHHIITQQHFHDSLISWGKLCDTACLLSGWEMVACSQNNSRVLHFKDFKAEVRATYFDFNDIVLFNQQMGTLPLLFLT